MKLRQKILTVDDEALNREILADYLSIAGFEVIEADDGDTALQMLADHPDVDAIVLDRMMPRMDGMKVLSTLKNTPHLRDIPVIIQTAAASSEQIVEGIRAGAYYYLTKPYEDIILLGIISAAIDGAAEKKNLRDEIVKNYRVQALLQQGRFPLPDIGRGQRIGRFHRQLLSEPGNGRPWAAGIAGERRGARQSRHHL